MWIKSQDKTTLLKVEKVFIKARDHVMESGKNTTDETLCSSVCAVIDDPNGRYIVYANNYHPIGLYSNKEKTLKVLDQIEEYINLGFKYKDKEFGVFQMPKDEEV